MCRERDEAEAGAEDRCRSDDLDQRRRGATRRPGAAVLFVKSLALGDWTLAGAILAVFAAIKFGADFVGRVGARLVANPGGRA